MDQGEINIHLVLVAYTLDIMPLVYDLSGSDTTWHIYAHSNRANVVEAYNQLGGLDMVRFHNYGTNRGLARSWNDGIVEAREEGADVMMIANDDLIASRADLLLLANAAVEHRDYGIIEGTGLDQRMNRRQSMAFALCAINPLLIEKVGLFDENLFPINFEDSDLARRCGLAGVRFWNVGETGIVHAGTATVNSVPELMVQHSRTFQANKEYYIRKHGGEPGSETFDHPFNNPALDWKIAPEDRHDPYPGYGRVDQEIVRL